MKTNEKKAIAVLVSITIVVIIQYIIINNSSKNQTESKNQEQEETITILEDGSLLNTSSKLQETKKIEGLEISNIQLIQKQSEAILTGTITNISNEKQGNNVVAIQMLDEQGNEIIILDTYIGEIQPNKSAKFSTRANFESSKVYDFKLTKK